MAFTSLYSMGTVVVDLQSSTGIPAQPGYRPVFGDFVPVPAGILLLAGILVGIFPK